MEPFDVVYDGDIMRCPGVGDNTSNLAIMMLLAAWFTKNNYIPKCGILFVASSGEEGLGNLKGKSCDNDRAAGGKNHLCGPFPR